MKNKDNEIKIWRHFAPPRGQYKLPKQTVDELNNYVDYITQNSFDYDNDNFSVGSQEFFHHGGFLIDTHITEDQMKKFIEKYDDVLNKIAENYLIKIEKTIK